MTVSAYPGTVTDGPTAVEYAVMLALIIVVCIAVIATLSSNANGTFADVGSGTNTGPYPP
jgi:Flp pilus assembly pilin Flp